MGADPIPAVREESAEGEIASIFADLRETLGLPLVNLIWRHLATIPGALPWTWGLLKPLYRSGAIEDHAAALRDASRPRTPPLDAWLWDAAGLPEGDRRSIAAVIGDYDRGNSLNLVALLVARSVLRGDASGEHPDPAASGAASARRPAPAPGPFPRLLGLDELTPPVLQLVRALDRLGRLGDSDAIASLYRHLGHWPSFLALGYAALLPLDRDGTLRGRQEVVLGAARTAAAALAGRLGPAAPPEPAERERILAALDEFTSLMIGRMVVMGAALAGLLPRETGGAASRA